jgi:hypothetical protein
MKDYSHELDKAGDDEKVCKPLGIHRLIWENNIKEDLKETVRSVLDAAGSGQPVMHLRVSRKAESFLLSWTDSYPI